MNPRFCPGCGTAINLAGAGFCAQCGLPLTALPPAMPVTPLPVALALPPARQGRAALRRSRRGKGLLLGGLFGLLLGGALVLFLTASAGPNATPALRGALELGPAVALVNGSSQPGSLVTLVDPTDPLNGLALSVPPEAYAVSVEFTLSSSPISGQSYGPLIHPVSPLITVDNGEQLAAVPLSVRIPVTIPAGQLALAFYVRPDGGLEAIPTVSEDAGSITIATRHFSAFFVSTIASALLPSEVGTGFHPGVDDFSTPNYGSVAFPDGHCAGQALAELWYFSERKSAGQASLWDRYDASSGGPKTPGFWQDDAAAYRLASTVHGDLNWDTLSGQIGALLRTNPLDRLTYDTFRYAMLVSGAPQFVGVSASGQGGGHVLVAYAVTPSGLWVADPNFPGELRQVVYAAANGTFTPYRSGSIAGAEGNTYDQIGFYGRTALVDWAQIGERFAEVDGQKPAALGPEARFPDYDIQAEIPGPNGSPSSPVSVLGHFSSPSASLVISPQGLGTDLNLRVSAYAGTRLLGSAESNQSLSLDLAPGVNEIGFYLEGQTDKGWRALDFARSSITAPGAPSPAASPSPRETSGSEPASDSPGTVTVKDPADWTFDCAQPPPANPEPDTLEMQYVLAWAQHCGGK